MSKIVFTKGSSTFTFTCDRIFPVEDPPQVNVPVDYSEGGQLYAYDKGIVERFYNLVFDRATDTDNANLENWLLNVVVGPKSTFTCTDESGVDHTVRMLDTRNPLRKIKHNVYAGTIRLREEIL